MRRWEWLFLAVGLGLFALLLRQFGIHSLLDTIVAQGPRFGWVLLPTLGSYLLFCSAWWLTLLPSGRRLVRFPYLLVVSIAGFSPWPWPPAGDLPSTGLRSLKIKSLENVNQHARAGGKKNGIFSFHGAGVA